MNLSEIVGDAAAKVRKTILVAHSSGAANSKASMAERLAALYDLALEIVPERGGEVLKHAGGSLFVIFEAARATDGILAGAALLSRAAQTGAAVTVALSYGDLAHFETDRGVDYLGLPLERAFELSLRANPGALVVDEAITLAAAMGQMEAALNRNDPTGDFLGERHNLELTAQSETVAAYELHWSEARSGFKAQGNTGASSITQERNQWVSGVVSSLGGKFGFIVDRAGVAHYFQTRNLAFATPLKRGSRVVFRARPALKGAKERRAEDIFVVDAPVEGTLSRLNPAGWGFVKLSCENGLEHNLFVLGLSKDLSVGQQIRCRLGVNDQGPMGYQPVAITDTVADELTEVAEELVPTLARIRTKVLEAVAAD